MVYFKGTGLLPLALRQLTEFLLRKIVTFVLPCMAGFAEVSVAPAEPLTCLTAEFAFKLDELCSMDLAVLHSSSNGLGRTASANKLCRIKGFIDLLIVLAILEPSEIRLLTLEAKVIR
jgi:hypothetical protein